MLLIFCDLNDSENNRQNSRHPVDAGTKQQHRHDSKYERCNAISSAIAFLFLLRHSRIHFIRIRHPCICPSRIHSIRIRHPCICASRIHSVRIRHSRIHSRIFSARHHCSPLKRQPRRAVCQMNHSAVHKSVFLQKMLHNAVVLMRISPKTAAAMHFCLLGTPGKADSRHAAEPSGGCQPVHGSITSIRAPHPLPNLPVGRILPFYIGKHSLNHAIPVNYITDSACDVLLNQRSGRIPLHPLVGVAGRVHILHRPRIYLHDLFQILYGCSANHHLTVPLFSNLSSTGCSAIYFSNISAASPTSSLQGRFL